MHHLLMTIGSHGDTHPFVGIGRELRRRGHRVTLAANELFEPLARSADLEFIALGTTAEYREAIGRKELWHPVKGFKTVFESGVLPLMPRAYEIIKELYVPGETIVTAHAIVLGARIAQEKLGVPLVNIHLSPAVMRSASDPPVLAKAGLMQWSPRPVVRAMFRLIDWGYIDPVVAWPLNAFRAELGLPRVKRVLDRWWMSPQRVIGLWPQWYAPAQSDWPAQMKLTGFPLYDERGVESVPPEMASFLAAGPPPIAFTFGSAMTHARELLQTSADACHRLGQRGILLTRFREQVPAYLPEGVRHFDYAPFSELLPRCAALVHHGGIGTTAQCLAAGIPQLIVPFAHDQHDNVSRIKQLGAGVDLSPKKYRPKRVAEILDRLRSDAAMARRCREVSALFKGHDSLGETCDVIDEAATNGLRVAEV